MANVSITPNMGLPSPVPGVDPAPDWANNNFSCFSIVDAHTHSPGSGVQIVPSGLNINSDLSFQANNAVAIRTIRFNPQISAITASSPDLGCIYEAGVDLYYNDGSGNQIRITQSGSLAGAAGTITGLPSGTASASYQSASGTFVFQQATSTAANMDIGTLIVRYPGSYPTPSGNYIALQAPTSLASGYALTLPSLPGSTLPVTLTSAGILSSQQVTQAMIGDQSVGTDQLKDGNITDIKFVAHTITGDSIVSSVDLPGKTVRAEGANVVVSNTQQATHGLSVVRGIVNSSQVITSGEGFSVNKTGTGVYTVTWSAAFLDAPAVVVCSNQGPGFTAAAISSTTTSVSVSVLFEFTASDGGFNIIAIGQRA